MGQCRTLDADVAIGWITVHVTTPFLHPFFIWNKKMSLTLLHHDPWIQKFIHSFQSSQIIQIEGKRILHFKLDALCLPSN